MIKLTVEIADNPYLLAQGLMGRHELSRDRGMLFLFPLKTASFWGKDTYIPLDIAFVHNNEIIDIKEIVPLSTRAVRSDGLCNMAIETNRGFFKANNIKVGHRIKIQDQEVTFECSE